MSYSYKEFPLDVESAFEKLIKAHNLSVEKREDYYVGLSNRHVIIDFSFDKGTLYSELRKSGDNFSFSIYQVYEHLYGSALKNYFERLKIGEDELGYPKSDLIGYAKLFENELSSILNGNFEWYEELRTELEYEKQLVGVVLGPHLPHPNPISKKFWNGDPTWKEDVEKFIKEEKIEIKLDYNSTIPKAGRKWWQKLFGS